MFGPLAAGAHNYAIQVTDNANVTTSAAGSFVVTAFSTPVISLVTVAEATPQNGILESNEVGVITWAVTDPNTITSRTLTVDGVAATAVYGPYGPFSGALYYAGTFGPLAAGSHSFVIKVTDSKGFSSTYNGAFPVTAVVTAAAHQRVALLNNVLDEMIRPII